MEAGELRERQAPIKQSYREDPQRALVHGHAEGTLTAGITCTVPSWAGETVAGIHPAAGGDGSKACSADMLLEALVACAGVTMNSVATAMGVQLRSARVRAEGTWDARGTLGVAKDAPVGLTDVRLIFDLDTDADEKTRTRLIELTERYCVIYQTLRNPPALSYGEA